ncbi:hypothetical protein M2175_001267 [Bradyrhizobium elkanii]|nr:MULTISPECIES: hypothetical protein [Bradyrhizobium]MCS3926236.1 hypothetical protein [Bradyrhizobium elkanii]MCS3966789.1 hypothetical protein [Bradyrhizobium japonicum]
MRAMIFLRQANDHPYPPAAGKITIEGQGPHSLRNPIVRYCL